MLVSGNVFDLLHFNSLKQSLLCYVFINDSVMFFHNINLIKVLDLSKKPGSDPNIFSQTNLSSF